MNLCSQGLSTVSWQLNLNFKITADNVLSFIVLVCKRLCVYSILAIGVNDGWVRDFEFDEYARKQSENNQTINQIQSLQKT